MHSRLFPRRNNFRYGLFYLALPLSRLNEAPLCVNKWSLISFYERDHGACDGSDLLTWARGQLDAYGLDKANGDIVLVCMPRILGYVFNPVSFWLCYDRSGGLRAVLAEVHNTFGERHVYVCAHEDQRPIKSRDVLDGEKVFHVSPFLQRDGRYEFRFDISEVRFGVWIDYFDGQGQKQLVTYVKGDCDPMSGTALRRLLWEYPLVTFKVIGLIHWQALKLVLKGISYVRRPLQMLQKRSRVRSKGDSKG